ncbi:MAG: hmu [Ignavibacteria bacterium]|nr:hmu [Ignavibacteria bacterium]
MLPSIRCKAVSRSFLILSVLLITILTVRAERFAGPEGEQILKKEIINNNGTNYRLTATRYYVYLSKYQSVSGWSNNKEIFAIPEGKRIIDTKLKLGETGNIRTFALAFDDGTLMFLGFSISQENFTGTSGNFSLPAVQINSFRRILIHSKYHALYNNVLYTKTDETSPWFIDSVGLNRANIRDFTYDNSGNLFAATTDGIYKMTAGSSTFENVTTFNPMQIGAIYSNKKGDIYIYATGLGPFVSTDNGSSWTADTNGISTQTINSFSDDSAGTMYALFGNNFSSILFRKKTGMSWERIDTILNSYLGTTIRISDIGGFGTLEASTGIGIFTSTDFGNTWSNSSKGILAEDIYGLHQLGTNQLAVSTGLGIFVKNPSTGNWNKTFPANGYGGGRPLYKDNSGNLFTQGVGFGMSGTITPVYKSTDGGNLWNVDSTGLYNVNTTGGQSVSQGLFVDEDGNYHYGISSLTQGALKPLRIFSKPLNSNWNLDTLGINLGEPSSTLTQLFAGFGSDGKGNLFFGGALHTPSYNFIDKFLYKRSQTNSQWSLDTSGLGNKAILSYTADKNGQLYVGSLAWGGVSGIFRKNGNQWVSIPVPPAASVDVRAMMVDNSGKLYALFASIQGGNQISYKGVYLTTDNGSTWDYAGMDSVPVRGLSVINDSMYAYTAKGIFKLFRETIKSPKMVIDSKFIDFGTVKLKSSKDTIVKIRNTGNDTLRINRIIQNPELFSIISQPDKVAPGGAEDFKLRFSPVMVGKIVSKFYIQSNDYPDSITCNAEGILPDNPPVMVLNKHSIKFDSVKIGNNKDSMVTITNSGNDTLNIALITSSNNAFLISSTSFIIAPGESDQFMIRFRPTQIKVYNAVIQFFGNMLPDSILVTGTGYSDSKIPQISINPKNVDFGKVKIGTPMKKIVDVSNTGTDTLRVTQILGSNSALTAVPQIFIVAPGGTEKVTLSFNPSALGVINGIYKIFSNDFTDTIYVTGEGISQNDVSDDFFYPNNRVISILASPVPASSQIAFVLTNQSMQSLRIQGKILNYTGVQLFNLFDRYLNPNINQTYELDIAALPSGVYFLLLEGDGIGKALKFEIIK